MAILISYKEIDDRAKEEIINQGGHVYSYGVRFPDDTESDALASDFANNNFYDAEFVLPDGLVIFLHRGNLTTIKPKSIILTPAQFTAARALAQAYHHLWGGVPDGTYDINDISDWSGTIDTQFAGIASPWIREETEDSQPSYVAYHRTGGIARPGNGRLSWEIRSSGNITLRVHRPISLLKENDREGIDEGAIVATLQIINDDDQVLNILKHEDYVYSRSWRNAVTETPMHTEYDENLRDDLLCERHVWALVKPLVALFAVDHPEPLQEPIIEGEDHETYYNRVNQAHQEYRRQYIHPAIEKAKAWLKPLFDVALPDPLPSKDDVDDDFQYPETYWTRPRNNCSHEAMMVFHRGESFPVESEKTAVHAILLLKDNSEMDLVEAIKSAIKAKSYRPE